MGSLMPGAFPIELLSLAQSSAIESPSNKWNSLSTEDDKLASFNRSEFLVNKAKGQRHLLRQLEGCVYILVGYELVKYCHLACLLPFILDLMTQSMISVRAIVEPDNWSLLETINEVKNRKEQESGESQATQRSNMTKFICLSIYGKFLLIITYHALFIFWLKLIADSGHLDEMVNGSWWLVSFIGETVVADYDTSSSIWLQLWQLGLYQLILIDFLILLLQLTLYQSIHKQSSKSLEGLPLNIDELETVRPYNARVSGDTLRQLPQKATPEVLNIRLHDCFNSQSYLGFVFQ